MTSVLPPTEECAVDGWSYDGAGNITSISGMSRSFGYDAENRLVTAAINGATSTYSYDGDGRRVQKTTPSGTTTFVYDAAGQLAAEYSTAPNTVSGPEYLTADHLGSTRLVTDASGNSTKCYDYLPFGEEIPNGYGGRTASCFGAGSYPSAPDVVSEKFTGKERDAETGLDYFGARYMSSAQGRFTSVDPLMASSHTSNPQSWNRYAYALNNPLRFVDPNGMDVPAACAEDKNCQIIVKVKPSGGLTDKERQTFEKNQLQQAQKDFGNSNIKLQFSYTQGSYTVNDSDQPQLTGLKSDSLNLVVSTTTPRRGEAGVSGLAGNGTAVSFLNFNDVNNSNLGPFLSNTTEHEMGHQFLGDPQTGRTPGFFEHMGRDMQIDSMNTAQGRGASQSGYRQGLEPRVYAVPANPEANKPQKK